MLARSLLLYSQYCPYCETAAQLAAPFLCTSNLRLYCYLLSIINHLLHLSYFEPISFRGTSSWSQRINPSLPSAHLALCSRGLGQHFDTTSTHNKLNPLLCLLTSTLLPRLESDTKKKKPYASGVKPSFFPAYRTVTPLGRGGSVVFRNKRFEVCGG